MRNGRNALAALKPCVEALDQHESNGLTNVFATLLPYAARIDIDWDLVLRMGNAWFNRIADACRQPSQAAQRAALRKLDDDFRKLKATAADTASLDESLLDDPTKAFSERVVQVMLITFLPTTVPEVNSADRATMTFELTKLAFALAAYRADHGEYPAMLADLTPKYVVDVPKDMFNDAELHYRLEGKGYLLYSVGNNGKDDEAKSYNDRKNDEDWDDLVVRMPAPTMTNEKQ